MAQEQSPAQSSNRRRDDEGDKKAQRQKHVGPVEEADLVNCLHRTGDLLAIQQTIMDIGTQRDPGVPFHKHTASQRPATETVKARGSPRAVTAQSEAFTIGRDGSNSSSVPPSPPTAKVSSTSGAITPGRPKPRRNELTMICVSAPTLKTNP